MKKLITIFAAVLITASVFAQAPQKMSYQAVILNTSNALVTSTAVGMQISILQGSPTGTAVYVETQTPSTNANGLVSLEIGTGTIVTGTFAGINWATGPYFIKTETDPTGGTAYTIAGTNELMSVPYALFSANGTPGATGAAGTNGAVGATGAAGTNGTPGATGAAGTNGVDGAVGATGTVGATGAAGTTGSVGSTGAAGTNGAVGLTGLTGAVGATGSQGIQGIAGNDGAVGATGSQGIQGIQGLTGLAGATGSVGATGSQGPIGLTGAAGGEGPFKLGKDTLGGIVYYIYIGADNLQHGLIVSKTESTAVWQASGTLTGANRTWDGAFNTTLMTSSAAATYIATLGAGWYLPSIDELSLLWQSRFTSNKALNTGGFTLLSTTAYYWSSTESIAASAVGFYFYRGYAYNNVKTDPFSVRGVRAF